MTIYVYIAFPDLALESLGLDYRNLKIATYLNQNIQSVSEQACAQGVLPGMTLGMASTLCPDLLLKPENKKKQRKSLHRLALWAYKYSNQVAILDQALCLEITKSTLLLGDLPNISQILKTESQKYCNRILFAFGYTPEMAALFVKHRKCPKEYAFLDTVFSIQITECGLHQNHAKRLTNMGFRTLGEYFKAPTRARQTRLPKEIYLELNALAGRYHKPIQWFTPPKRFAQSLEFLCGLTTYEMLRFPMNRLLYEASQWLRIQHSATSALHWRFKFENSKYVEKTITLNQPSAQMETFSEPTWLALEKIKLEVPVIEVMLDINNLVESTPERSDLFKKYADTDRAHLLDKLKAKLGQEAIYSLLRLSDPRPEKANLLHNEISEPASLPDLSPRPIWIESSPITLGSSPEKCGFQLLRGPERIESGWWDFEPACRQYWVALSQNNRISWIYYDQHKKSWWIAGWFT